MRPEIALCVSEKGKRISYEGTLAPRRITKDVAQAYDAYSAAKKRSKRAGLPPPEMTAREFVGWWLQERATFDGTAPTCGRIDHSRGYFWDNIEMQDRADNSRECALRNKLGRDKTKIVASLDGAEVMCFSSMRSAAIALSVGYSTIRKSVYGIRKDSTRVLYTLEAA